MPGIRGRKGQILVLGLIILSVGLLLWACRFSQKKLAICEVQGGGEISQYLGKKISIQGIVSSERDEVIPSGFFLVDQNCPEGEDGSLGIFVEMAVSRDVVHLGDEVLVKGVVEEVGGETRIMSDQSEMVIISLGNELPSEINLAELFLFDPDTFQYENLEGMLVSVSKGEFMKGFVDSDLPRVLPLFDLDPALQMVCLPSQSIILQLSNLEKVVVPWNLTSGDQVQNLVGILRQNTAGYVLELTAASDIKVLGRQGSPRVVEENLSEGMGSTGTQVVTPGTASVTPSAAFTSTLIPSATIIPSLTYYPVHLLISEVYPNPTGKEPEGEWVEIYNLQSYAQSLSGIKLGDETSATGNEGMLRFPDGYRIGGNEVLVIANQAKVFLEKYGFQPDFEMEDSDSRIPDLVPYSGWGRSGIQFSNSGDEVLLLDHWNGVVDQLVYGNSTAAGFSEPPQAPGEGHSLERYPPEMDRDRGGDWREREQPSPGRLDRSPPTLAPSLTLAPSPTLTLTPTLIPTSTSTVSPSPAPSGTVSSTVLLSTPTAGLITSTPSLTPSQTMANTVTMTPAPSPTLISSQIPSPTLTVTEDIPMTPSITVISTTSFTPSLTLTTVTPAPSQPDITATGTEVVTVTPVPSITPSQQPTATVTTVYLEDPIILLNEIHADPDSILGDANKDGQVHSDDDEFLEFVNIGDSGLDLSGWKVADFVKIRYEFPAGTILKEGCGVVVFGGGVSLGDFGGSLVFSTGSLGLNNAGDTIFLIDENGKVRLDYLYGAEGGKNQSLTRWPDISGELPLVLHSEVEGSSGVLYSPGTRVDGSVFGDCP